MDGRDVVVGVGVGRVQPSCLDIFEVDMDVYIIRACCCSNFDLLKSWGMLTVLGLLVVFFFSLLLYPS